jgi:hypothetical protein
MPREARADPAFRTAGGDRPAITGRVTPHGDRRRGRLFSLNKIKITQSERNIMLGPVLLVLLVLMLLGALPTWPHSRTWGYYPSGGLGLLLAILLILVLLGRI